MNAVKLRNQVMQRFEAADRDPAIIEDGALNFVIVGAGHRRRDRRRII